MYLYLCISISLSLPFFPSAVDYLSRSPSLSLPPSLSISISLSLSLFTCLSIFLSVYPALARSLSLSMFLSSHLIYLSLFPSINPSIHLYLSFSIYLPSSLLMYLSLSLSLFEFLSLSLSLSLSPALSLYRSIHPFIHPSILLAICKEATMRDFLRKRKLTGPKQSNSARHPQKWKFTARKWYMSAGLLQSSKFARSKTKQFCETSFKNKKLSAELTASCQCGLWFLLLMSEKHCACHGKAARSYKVLRLSHRIMFKNLPIRYSKTQPISGN